MWCESRTPRSSSSGEDREEGLLPTNGSNAVDHNPTPMSRFCGGVENTSMGAATCPDCANGAKCNAVDNPAAPPPTIAIRSRSPDPTPPPEEEKEEKQKDPHRLPSRSTEGIPRLGRTEPTILARPAGVGVACRTKGIAVMMEPRETLYKKNSPGNFFSRESEAEKIQ